jgi:hypothetical protein
MKKGHKGEEKDHKGVEKINSKTYNSGKGRQPYKH